MEFTAMTTAFQGIVSDITPVVGTIGTAALGFYAAKLGWKVGLRFFNNLMSK